jgi:outer membrane protein TolC
MRFFLLLIFILTVLQLQGQDLHYYIEQAKLNSPLIQENKNQIEATNLEVERLKAIYTKAQVSLSGGYLFAPALVDENGKNKLVLNPSGSEEDYFGYDISATNGGMYQGLVNIDQPLFNGGRFEVNKELARVGIQINENAMLLTAHELEKFVTDQYILCLQNYKETEYLISLVDIVENQKEAVLKLVENGITKQSDLALIIIEQKSLQTELYRSRSVYLSSLMDLRVACGIPDTTYQVIEDIHLKMGDEVKISKFTEKYMLDSLNLIAAQDVFELKYKPIVGLYANAGLNAVYAPTLGNRLGISAGINFSMNILDGNQKKISQQRTQVLMQSTSQYKHFFFNQNTVRKNKIIAEIKSIDERILLTEDQLNEYQRLLQLYRQELIQGQLSVFNYIGVLKNMVSAQRDYVLLHTNKELLINLYNYWNW